MRSVVPKLTKDEKEFVDSFKNAARPRSSIPKDRTTSQKSMRASSRTRPSTASARLRNETPSSKTDAMQQSNNDENNPLSTDKVDTVLKQKRLQIHGKAGGCWPEFPESPSSEATHSEVRKSWSTLIHSSTVQTLLPKNGASSMENYLRGCDLIMKSITHSRDNNDDTIIQQLDLLLKWASCALSSREHTAALRKLLSVISALFQRLHELQYVMNDVEAQIILPYLLDIAGMMKSTFQDQFLQILSFVTKGGNVYTRKQYGTLICVKVLAKSPRAKSRLLAAKEIEKCLRDSVNLEPIGKPGLQVLAKALSNENLAENRGVYVSLFQVALEKMDGDLAKLFLFCKDYLSEYAKGLIQEKCSKRSVTNQNSVQTSLRLHTPSRPSGGLRGSITTQYSEASPSIKSSEIQKRNLSRSSPAIKGDLHKRFERSKLPPSSSSQTQDPSPRVSSTSRVDKMFQDINCIVEHGDLSAEPDLITILNNLSQAISADPGVLNIDHYDEYVKSIAG